MLYLQKAHGTPGCSSVSKYYTWGVRNRRENLATGHISGWKELSSNISQRFCRTCTAAFHICPPNHLQRRTHTTTVTIVVAPMLSKTLFILHPNGSCAAETIIVNIINLSLYWFFQVPTIVLWHDCDNHVSMSVLDYRDIIYRRALASILDSGYQSS